jgi:hypothetical protein
VMVISWVIGLVVDAGESYVGDGDAGCESAGWWAALMGMLIVDGGTIH